MDLFGVGISLTNLLGVSSWLVAGLLIYGIILSIAYAILLQVPKRLDEIEKRIKKLEEKEK